MTEKTEIKDRIKDLATEMLLKYGYKNVKTDDLASELGISKRTLYEHFPSKNDLIFEILTTKLNEFHNKMNAIADNMINSEKETFFEEFANLWEAVNSHSQFFSKELNEDIKKYLPEFYKKCRHSDQEKFAKFQKSFLVGVKHGYFKSDINEQLFFQIMYISLNSILQPDNLSLLPFTAAEVITQIHKVLYTGAMTEETQKMYKNIINKNNNL